MRLLAVIGAVYNGVEMLLGGQQADLLGADAERLHAGVASRIVQEDQAARNEGVPFRKAPGDESWTVRSGAAAAKIDDCRWLKPAFVGQLEFVEWNSANHLRQSRFIGLRDDEKPKAVRREG